MSDNTESNQVSNAAQAESETEAKGPKSWLKGEHWKTGWTHPYALFVYLNIILAIFLGLMGWAAVHFGWLPDKGL